MNEHLAPFSASGIQRWELQQALIRAGTLIMLPCAYLMNILIGRETANIFVKDRVAKVYLIFLPNWDSLTILYVSCA